MAEAERDRVLAAKASGVRERILDAALEILRGSGLQRLSQPQVAKLAGVRQSHLTYYFPTRDDLLEAVTERGVDLMACGLRRAVAGDAGTDQVEVLERLVSAVTDLEHMRMFVAMIVEADGDATVREIMMRATRRMETALAEALADGDAVERARVILAAAWGVGLYRFLMRPSPEADLEGRYVSWLAEASGARRVSMATRAEPGDGGATR